MGLRANKKPGLNIQILEPLIYKYVNRTQGTEDYPRGIVRTAKRSESYEIPILNGCKEETFAKDRQHKQEVAQAVSSN